MVIEALAWHRHRPAQHVPLGRSTQRFARHLVLAAVLLFTTAPKHATTTIELRDITPAVAFADTPTPQSPITVAPTPTTEAPAMKTYVVKPHDDLWTVAERHLGDGQRWREIFDLNKGKLQPQQRSLQDPGLIRPGWTLQMPTDAVGLEESTTAPRVAVNTTDVAVPPPTAAIPTESAPSTTTTTTTTIPSADSESSVDVASSSLPLVALLGGGIGAAGLATLLVQLRRVQQRRRPIGTRVPLPAVEIQETERALRISADASEAERLDLALRALSCCLSQHKSDDAPKINAVRVHETGVEILFDQPVGQPSGPFEQRADGQAWWLASDVHEIRIGALATDVVAPIPALVSVGTVDGATVLVDLEAARTTSINGDDTVARRMLHAMTLEAATSQWADFLNVFTIGNTAELSQLERVRTYDTLPEALDDLGNTKPSGPSAENFSR